MTERKISYWANVGCSNVTGDKNQTYDFNVELHNGLRSEYNIKKDFGDIIIKYAKIHNYKNDRTNLVFRFLNFDRDKLDLYPCADSRSIKIVSWLKPLLGRAPHHDIEIPIILREYFEIEKYEERLIFATRLICSAMRVIALKFGWNHDSVDLIERDTVNFIMKIEN